MLIRPQDKMMTVTMGELRIEPVDRGNWIITKGDIVLGMYDSKERAIEELDLIVRLNNMKSSIYVYQMREK